MEGSTDERFDFGKMGFGCKHYRRRCKIRAPCCNEIFDCRHCHNEFTSMFSNPFDRHELVRSDVTQVICSVCDTEQMVSRTCTNCGVNMGEYFCVVCKFYDDDIDKGQFHCDDCGICRVGGRDNFFHCDKCGSCYSVSLRNNHSCVENSMHHHCPICYEYLFDSLKYTTVMKCGHTMHCECYHEMIKRDKYCCPICSRSVVDMSRTWKRIDEEVESTVMPEDYRYKKVLQFCPYMFYSQSWSINPQIRCCLQIQKLSERGQHTLNIQKLTDIRRYGYYVMTAMTQPRCSSI